MQTILADMPNSAEKTSVAALIGEYVEMVEIPQINDTFKGVLADASATDATIKTAYDKRKADLANVVAKYNARKAKAEKAKTALETLQAKTNPDYTSLDKDEFGDVIIKTFNDLIAAEKLAYQNGQLEAVANNAAGIGNTVREVLNTIKTQRNSLEKTATKLLFDSLKKDDIEKQIIALLSKIPQLAEIFTEGGVLQNEKMLSAMVAVFNIKDTDAVYENLLRALLDPVAVEMRLTSYINLYNTKHNINISTEFQDQTNDAYNLAKTIETFTEAVGSDEFRGTFAKLKALNIAVEKLRDTTALSALKLINNISDFEAVLDDVAVSRSFGPETDSIINEDSPALNAETKYGHRASGGDRTTGGAENPNDLMITLEGTTFQIPYINGEHYVHTQETKDAPAVYRRIEFPKEKGDPELYKKILNFFISDDPVSLDDDTVTQALKDFYGEAEVEAQKRAITAYRRYANNNRFFYWTDNSTTLQGKITEGEVYLQAMTYEALKNSKEPGLNAIAKTIDTQIELEPDENNKAKLEDFRNSSNVLFIPYTLEKDKLVPVTGLTQIEEEYNKTQKIEVNKIQKKVLFTSRPLASSLYPTIKENKKTTYEKSIENALGLTLVNPGPSKVGTPGIEGIVKTAAIKIEKTSDTTIKITYTNAKAEKVIKDVTLSPEDVIAVTTNKSTKENQIAFRGTWKLPSEVLKMSIALAVESEIHENQTKQLVTDAGKFVQVEKRNQGYPNFATMKDANGESVPAQMKITTAFPSKIIGLSVVGQNTAAEFPGTIPGDVIVKIDDTFVPVVNTTFANADAKLRNNMLDVLSLTLMKIESTSSSDGLTELRTQLTTFPNREKIIIPVGSGTTKTTTEISGYTYFPDFSNNASTISAIGFYMNFGWGAGNRNNRKEVKNRIYIERGKLVFTQRGPNNTFEKIEIPLKELQNENGVIDLKALFKANNTLNTTERNENLYKLQLYLESKRVNVNKKLLAINGGFTMLPKVDGALSKDSKISYEKVNTSYHVWAVNNIVSTNYADGSKRRHLQRNLKHEALTQDEVGILAAATAKKAEAFKKITEEAEKSRKEAEEKAKTPPPVPSTEPADTNGVLSGSTLNIPALAAVFNKVFKSEKDDYPFAKETLDELSAQLGRVNKKPMTVLSVLNNLIAEGAVKKTAVLTPVQVKIVTDFITAYNADEKQYDPVEEPPTPPIPPASAPAAPITSPTVDSVVTFSESAFNSRFNDFIDTAPSSLLTKVPVMFNGRNMPDKDSLHSEISDLVYADYEKLSPVDKAVVNKELDPVPFSKFNNSTRDKIVFAEAKANVAAMFGQKFADSEVDLVVGLIQEEGYGAFTQDGKILLSNLAEAGTEYHEAFHRVWRRFTSPAERSRLIAEFELRADKEQRLQEIRDAGYKGSREYLIEEVLAEEFKLYSDKFKLKNGRLVPKSFIERLFDRLVRFLSGILDRPLQQQLYDNILNSKYEGRVEGKPYENHSPILSRSIKFASNDVSNNSFKVSSDIAIAINEAITVGMFSEEMQKGNLYNVLNNIETDLTASFKASLQKQLVSATIANKNSKKNGYKHNSAILNTYLPEVADILAGPYDSYFKMFVLNSNSLVRILHNSKALGNLLTEIKSEELATLPLGEQAFFNRVKAQYNETTVGPLNTTTAEDARLALSIYFQLKYASDPKAKAFAMNMGRNPKYPKDYFAYLNGTEVQHTEKDLRTEDGKIKLVPLINGLHSDNLALTKILAGALNESLHIDVLAAIGNRSDNRNNADYKGFAEATFKAVYHSEDPDTFYNQWKRSISNVGGKISATRLEIDQEQSEESTEQQVLEEAQDTRNSSFDKITFETDVRSSASTAFKLLIGASQAVDSEDKPILNVYGLPKAVKYDSTMNKLINTLGDVPQFALWDEFISFIETDNELISIANAINAMPDITTEDRRKRESIKVKIMKTFNNHIYDFSVNIIERDNVFSMSANSNATARSLREAWKGVLASEYAGTQRGDLTVILYRILNGNNPLDLWVAEGYGVDKFSTYLEALGMQIAPETLKAMTANDITRKYWGTVIYDLYTNILGKGATAAQFNAVIAAPSTLANAVYGYGTDGSNVGSKVDAIALLDAENIKDKSQSLMSNGKMYFAPNLNNHMTHIIDTVNYVATASPDVLNKYIQEQLDDPRQAYHDNPELLTTHANSWISDSKSSASDTEALVLARVKLLMLTAPHLFSAYNRNSYYLERAIFSGQRIHIQVFESVKNTMNNDSKSLSKMSNVELLTHFANNVLSGISRVMQHADRGTTYGLNMALNSSEADLRIIQRLATTNDSVVLFMDELDNNTDTGYFEYNASSSKKYNPLTKGLHPESYGVLSEYMQTAFEKQTKQVMPTAGDLSNKYFTEFALFAKSFNIEDHRATLQSYIKDQKDKLIKVYVDAGLLATQQAWENGKVAGVKPRYILAGKIESKKEEEVQAELRANLATVWSRSVLTHLEETILFTGNANKYKSPEDMFKRLNVQSSSGVLSNTSESFLDSVHQANIDAQDGLSDLGADAYTNQDSNKNLSLITEVVATEQSFTSEDAAKQVSDSVYRTMYRLSRLRGKSHPEAEKLAKEFAKESASNYKDDVNENDGQSWLNIFAYRQYLKSVDSWSEAQAKSFKYEMYILADMIRVKTNIERLENEGITPTDVDYAYTPEEVLLARVLTNNNNLTEKQYKANEKEYAEKINTWLQTKGGLAVLKPQYTGAVWMSEEHRLVDPLKRDTNIGVRKTSYDMLLPSILRGESYDKRAKFADLMFSMHEIGLDAVHMKSAGKAGTKKPVDLFKSTSGSIGEINPELFDATNHTYLEWKYMKDQQAISNEQYKEISDSVQARRNILGNQKHLGVPIDYPMQDSNGQWYNEERWVSSWERLDEDGKLAASRMYANEQEILDIQHEILIKSVNKLAYELDYDLRKEEYTKKQQEAISGITNIVKILLNESSRRDMPDNVTSAIQSLIDNKYVDLLPNAARIEPILMSIVSNNLLRLKRPGNMVPQIAITGMDKVGTVRQKLGVTRELNTYNIDNLEQRDTVPAEIITSLPNGYQKAVLNKYSKVTGNPNITLFEAVRLLNKDIADGKVVIEVFALRIPNQQMSSNDVFRVKQFYIGTKENFVYVPAETVVKAGSDFDIDKMNMYWSTMDENLEPIKYVQGSKTVRDLSNPNNRGGNKKTFAQEVSTLGATDRKIKDLEALISKSIEVDKNLNEILRLLEEKGEVTREDCEGAPTAEKGMVTNEITPGGKWEIIKEFKGKSHKEGGIDITVGNGKISMTNNNTKQPFTAAKGLVIAASGLVVGGDKDSEDNNVIRPVDGKGIQLDAPKQKSKGIVQAAKDQYNYWTSDKPDYTSPHGGAFPYKAEQDFATAYAEAPDKSEFWYKQKLIKKDVTRDNREFAYKAGGEFWGKYKEHLAKRFFEETEEDRTKRFNDALDLHARYGNPKIKFEASVKGEGRAYFSSDNILHLYDTPSMDKLMYDYKNELLHARQLKDFGAAGFVAKSDQDFKKYPKATTDKKYYDQVMYDDPTTIEGVHYEQYPGLDDRYNRNYKLEQADRNKDARARVLDAFKAEEMDPYRNQGSLRILQKALAEQGYDMKSSTKADGTMDGIWGKETKAAYAKYQQDMKAKEQQKPIVKKPPTKKK